jgi:hypothetical protein
VKKNWSNDPRIRCFKHFDVVGDLVSAWMTQSNLIKELDEEFEVEIEQKKFSYRCDFPL